MAAEQHVWARVVDSSALGAVLFGEPEGLTAYDASYLWLAQALDLELVTLDDDLSRAVTRARR